MNDTTAHIIAENPEAVCLEVWDQDGHWACEFWARDGASLDICSPIYGLPVASDTGEFPDFRPLRDWVREVSDRDLDIDEANAVHESGGDFVSWFIPLT